MILYKRDYLGGKLFVHMEHSFAMCFIYKSSEVRKSITHSYATVCFIAMKNKNKRNWNQGFQFCEKN